MATKGVYRKADMEWWLDQGGSIHHDGQVITNKDDLPKGGTQRIASAEAFEKMYGSLTPGKTSARRSTSGATEDNTVTETPTPEDGEPNDDGGSD